MPIYVCAFACLLIMPALRYQIKHRQMRFFQNLDTESSTNITWSGILVIRRHLDDLFVLEKRMITYTIFLYIFSVRIALLSTNILS